MPRYYPIYLDLTDKICLVVGGGPVAERKVAALLEAGATVRVVSLTLTPQLQAWSETGAIEAIFGVYAPEHLDGATLAFAATDRREVNAQVTSDAQARHIPANVADRAETGDFVTPAVVRRGELCLTVTTGGGSPTLAARIKDELEARFGPEYGDYVELLGDLRAYIKERTPDAERRRAALARLVEPDAESALRALLRVGQPNTARRTAEQLADSVLE